MFSLITSGSGSSLQVIAEDDHGSIAVPIVSGEVSCPTFDDYCDWLMTRPLTRRMDQQHQLKTCPCGFHALLRAMRGDEVWRRAGDVFVTASGEPICWR